MKILIIGGNGVIGKQVSAHFSQKHDVVIGGRTTGDVNVDISSSESIAAMYAAVGKVDAVICIAGEAEWGAFEELSEEAYYVGINSKLMGQVNLVRLGLDYMNAGGSFTLTTGILADIPVLLTASASMVNGGVHSFVRAVAMELKDGVRINAVSPGLVEESVGRYGDFFPGHHPVPMNKVITGYVRSVEGWATGEVITIY